MNDAEFSFADFARKAWRLRGPVGAILLLSLLLAFAWVLATTDSFNRSVRYYVTLRNIENSKFPNGSAFSPNDLLIPQVVSGLRSRFGIANGLPLKRYISIEYGSPLIDAVSEKYRAKLAARNLSQAELEDINSAYKNELESTMRSGLRIDVDYIGLGMDKAMGSALAVAIPQMWSDIYSKQFRIFMDTRLEEAAVTTSAESLDTAASILSANARLDGVNAGLKLISADNRLSSITTSDGLSPADLSAEFSQYASIYFYPLLSANRGKGDFVFDSYMRERFLNLEDLQRSVAGLDRTLSDLKDFQDAGKNSIGGNSAVTALGSGGGRENFQLADGALSQIIDLTNKASLSDYVKSVFERRQRAVEDISGLRKEIDRIQNDTQVRSTPEFRAAAAAELSRLTAAYQELLSRARNRMADAAGDLYLPQSGPFVSGSLIPIRAFLIFPLALIVGGILSLLLVLLWPQRALYVVPSTNVKELTVSAAE